MDYLAFLHVLYEFCIVFSFFFENFLDKVLSVRCLRIYILFEIKTKYWQWNTPSMVNADRKLMSRIRERLDTQPIKLHVHIEKECYSKRYRIPASLGASISFRKSEQGAVTSIVFIAWGLLLRQTHIHIEIQTWQCSICDAFSDCSPRPIRLSLPIPIERAACQLSIEHAWRFFELFTVWRFNCNCLSVRPFVSCLSLT